MIKYRKPAGIILSIILILVWGYFVWDVNVRYPNPEEKIIRPGETGLYKGLNFQAGNINIYTKSEFEKLYDFSSGEDEDGTYIVAEAVFENKTEETIVLSEDQPLYWPVEVGYQRGSNIEYGSFQALNRNYSGNTVLKPGEKMEVSLTFYIHQSALAYDEIKREDIRIVYSYYPTKNYILLNGQED